MNSLFRRRSKEKEKNEKEEKPPCIHQVQQHPEALTDHHVVEPSILATDTEASDTALGHTLSQNDAKGRCQICRQEQVAARNYRIRIIIGIFFPFALQALDVTIIASALPWIASDFNKLSQMNWIISAFNLCSATFIPIWGQMADIFGRTIAMEMALITMLIGSAFCTGAPLNAFPLLIFGRALQGLSVAGIGVISKAILADKVSLQENAKNTSIFSIFGGVSYAIGPVIGGYLTDSTWRWCFGINLPVAAAGAILVVLVLRPILLGPQPLPESLRHNPDDEKRVMRRFTARMSVIDYGGQCLFLFGMGLIILGLTWGGASYPWGDAHVIAPLVLGSVLVILFGFWEYLMVPGRYLARKFPLQKPTIPWDLLAQRNMGLLFYINLATGMAMTAVLYFVDIYFTLVKGYSASKAGIQLLYYTPGVGGGVYSMYNISTFQIVTLLKNFVNASMRSLGVILTLIVAMFMCNIYPQQTFFPLFFGSLVEATGITVLAWALNQGNNHMIFGMIALSGLGTGMRFMPMSLHGIGFFPNNIASVISLTSFAVPLGGTLAMTIMDTVFNNKAGLASSSSGSSSTSSIDFSNFISTISTLPPALQAEIRDSAKHGIVWAFIAILPCMWLCVLMASGLGNVRITKYRKTDEQGRTDFSENVTAHSFLAGVVRKLWSGKQKEANGGIHQEEKIPEENKVKSEVPSAEV